MCIEMYILSKIIREGKNRPKTHQRFCSPDCGEVKEMYTADYIIQTIDKPVMKCGTHDPYELCNTMHIVLYHKDLQHKLTYDCSTTFI